MTPLMWIKLGVVAALVAGSSFTTWYATSDHYARMAAERELEYETAYTAAVNAQLAEIQADAKRKKKAEEQHGKDQLLINGLAADRRVRINSICGTGTGGESTASQSADGKAGILSDRVDEAFAELQSATTELFQRCDQLNIDAIRLNNELPDE